MTSRYLETFATFTYSVSITLLLLTAQPAFSVPGRDSPQTPSGQSEPMDPRKRRPDPSFCGNRPLEKRNKYQNDVPTHPSKHSAPGRRGISSSQSLLRRSSGAGPSGMPMKPPSTTESMQNPGNHGRPSQYGRSQATSGAERPREPSIGNSSVVTVSPEGLENRTPTTMERAPPVPSMRPQAPGAIVGPNLRENPSISHPNHSSQRARATNTDLPHTLASLQRMKARKAAMSQKSSELAPDQLYIQIGELRRQFAEEREERNKERVEMSNQIKSLQNQLAIEQTQRSNDSGRLEKLETTISTHLESTAKAFEATKSFAAVSAEVKAHSNDINSFKAWKESQTSRAIADQNADAVRSRVDQQAVTKLQERMDKLNAEVLEKFEMYSSQHKRDMAKLSQENSQSSSGLKEKHDRILAQEQSLSKLNSRLSDIEKTNDQSAIDTVTENLNTLISAINKTEEDLHDLRINMTALKDGIPQSFVRLLDPMRVELQQKFKYINTKMDQQSKEITQAMKETQAKAIERMKGLMVEEDQKLSNRVESGLDGLQRQLNDIMVAYVNDNMELFGAWPSIVCAMIEIQKVIRDLNRNSDPAKRLKIQWTDVGDLMNQIKYTMAKR